MTRHAIWTLAFVWLLALLAAEAQKHWGFKRLVKPVASSLRGAGRARLPVDAFILAPLEAKGLSLSSDADRVRLVRGAHFDLTGLPLSPDEIGYAAVESRLGAPDPMAAILHVLGLDHNRLTFNLQGIEETLTDSKVTEARVVEELLV